MELSNQIDDSYSSVMARLFKSSNVKFMEEYAVLRIRNNLYTCMLNTDMEIGTMSKEFIDGAGEIDISDYSLNNGDAIEDQKPSNMLSNDQFQKEINELAYKQTGIVPL